MLLGTLIIASVSQGCQTLFLKCLGPYTYRLSVYVIFIGQLRQRYAMFQIIPSSLHFDIHRSHLTYPRSQTIFSTTDIPIDIHHYIVMVNTILMSKGRSTIP